MAEPFLGEIRLMAFNFAPHPQWAICSGQVISITENPQLYAVIGNSYGGNVGENFQLPDLRGRVPLHRGELGTEYYVRGQIGGTEQVALTLSQIPKHSHTVYATREYGDNKNPIKYPGQDMLGVVEGTGQGTVYRTPTSVLTHLNPISITTTGNSSPAAHNNMQPSIVLNFCICIDGLFPPRN